MSETVRHVLFSWYQENVGSEQPDNRRGNMWAHPGSGSLNGAWYRTMFSESLSLTLSLRFKHSHFYSLTFSWLLSSRYITPSAPTPSPSPLTPPDFASPEKTLSETCGTYKRSITRQEEVLWPQYIEPEVQSDSFFSCDDDASSLPCYAPFTLHHSPLQTNS